MTESGPPVEPLSLNGVAVLRGVRHVDERGYLRKVLVAADAREQGIDLVVDEVVTTTNRQAGTLRGLHYQASPFPQSKTLWVTSGALYDVLVDVRPTEPTYGRWMSLTLSADDDTALHIPAGVAHGYQTLEDDTTVTYLITGTFAPGHARTLCWNDQTLAIDWPRPVSVISSGDQSGMTWSQL